MGIIIYFLGFFLLNISNEIGVPVEHRPKIFSQNWFLQQILIIIGVLCIHYSGILK